MTNKPNWTAADRVIDITDIWIEQMDPENKRGEVCMAYIMREDAPCIDERHRCFTGIGFCLAGISVEDTSGIIYRDREWCQRVFGGYVVWRIEAMEMEAA